MGRSDALDAGTDAILMRRGLGTDAPPRPSVVDSEQREHAPRGVVAAAGDLLCG